MTKREKLNYFINVTVRQLPFFYRIYQNKSIKNPRIIGMIRERNEGLLLKDTLDYMSEFVDGIVVFDDASEDDSVQIALNHPAVVKVIRNRRWKSKSRIWEETSNRKKLHDISKKYNPEWFFYGDADERCEGDIRGYLLDECPEDVNVLRISLFDAYITERDQDSYVRGDKLYNFRKYYGPERRDIIMAWRSNANADFVVKDAREPRGIKNRKEVTKFYCQHYGKSLSIEQWEETCDYYVKYFPKYRAKWLARKGKAIHNLSDFDTPLYTWGKVKDNSVKIG